MGLSGRSEEVSATWTGVLVPPNSETYTFYISNDDNAEFKLGSNALVTIGCCSTTGWSYALTAGEAYDIFFSLTNGPNEKYIEVAWETPTITHAPIPASAFFLASPGTKFPESSSS